MALTIGAMTGGLSAAAVGKSKRAWKGVFRNTKAGQEQA
jgi:hypothetical protein